MEYPMYTKDFIDVTTACDWFGYQILRPRVTCADGWSVSIQASSVHYCAPREDGCKEYTEVELGYPSEEDQDLTEYAEDPEDPTNTVYGYVPVSVVDQVLRKHGGIVHFDMEEE